MKKGILPAIVVLLIISRCCFHYAIAAIPNDINKDRHLVELHEAKDSFYNLVIGVLLLIIYTSFKLSCHVQWFLMCGIVFCFTMGVFMLYPFLPDEYSYRAHDILFNPYFDSFTYLACVLCLYWYICLRQNWLK